MAQFISAHSVKLAERCRNLKEAGLRIGAGFKFKSEPNNHDFSTFHVEPLIDQAADLLDRCLRTRASWDGLPELEQIHRDKEPVPIFLSELRGA